MQLDIWFGLEKFFHIWTAEHFLSTCVWKTWNFFPAQPS